MHRDMRMLYCFIQIVILLMVLPLCTFVCLSPPSPSLYLSLSLSRSASRRCLGHDFIGQVLFARPSQGLTGTSKKEMGKITDIKG